MGRAWAVLSLLAVLVLSIPCRGETITVDPDGGGDHSEIQAAIDAADEGDTVIVRAGQYVLTEPILFSRTRRVVELVVRSESGPESTTIRMSSKPADPLRASVVIFQSSEPGTVVLEGFTITGGTGTGDGGGQGGGIHCTESSPTFRNCRISGNSAKKGGGVYLIDSSPRLVDCRIVNNSTGSAPVFGVGGGLLCKYDSTPVLDGCVVSGNRASSAGGGIYCSIGSSAVLNACVISDNVAVTAQGGGIGCQESSPTFTDCTIERNTAFGGGGVNAVCARPEFFNCTIRDNHAVEGGGARCNNSFPTFVNCTFSGNSANFIGGLSCAADPSFCAYAGDTILRNCIVWGNAGGSLAAFRDARITVTFSCIELNPTSDDESPMLWHSEGLVFGDGTIFEDPRFCGWEGSPDVYVDSSNSRLGDGTPANPYREISSALTFNLGLRLDSPCIGAGEGGRNMGADNGLCVGGGAAARRIHLGEGRYGVEGLSFARGVSLLGAGQEKTILEGTVLGLRTGAVLSDVTVTGGAPSGGVVVRDGQSPELVRCTISGNWSWTGGGGVACLDGASPTLRECRIVGNTAGTEELPRYGGGVFCADSSSPTLLNCIISQNVGTSNGGALYCRNECAPTLINCVLSGNRGRHGGAGFFHEGSVPRFFNCTITGNWVSTGRGGGLFSLGAPVMLINSIVWHNRGGSIEEATRVVATYSCIEGEVVRPGEGNINTDPRFMRASDWDDPGTPEDSRDDVPLEGDYHLRPDSPCIDSGTPVESSATDIEGIGRPCGAAYDMGAFEKGGCPRPPEPPPPRAQFRRGDANADGAINLHDGLLILRFLFTPGEARPACEDAADANDSGTLDVTDAVRVFLFLFSPSVEELAEPRTCGPDPTADDLECDFFPGCG